MYKNASDYGFIRNDPFFQPWFRLSDWLFTAYVWAGLPYVLLTYTFKYDTQKELNSYHRLIEFMAASLFNVLKVFKVSAPISRTRAKKILLGLLVRASFIPLMTVFFLQYFPIMV